MESNYVKSARIKLQKLSITNYRTFKKNEAEIMKIVEETIAKEYDVKNIDLESLPSIIYLKAQEQEGVN